MNADKRDDVVLDKMPRVQGDEVIFIQDCEDDCAMNGKWEGFRRDLDKALAHFLGEVPQPSDIDEVPMIAFVKYVFAKTHVDEHKKEEEK